MVNPESARPHSPRPGRFVAGFARLVVALRWWVIGFWVASTTLALFVLPSLSAASGSDNLRGFLPEDTPALQNEIRALQIFGFPLLGRTVVVQRDVEQLSLQEQAHTIRRAVAVNRGEYADLGPLLGAVPVTNVFGLFPSASERSTTALTYLFFRPGASFSSQSRAAREYTDRFFEPRDDVVGVTGSIPARTQQGRIIKDKLPLVELVTLSAIVLIVGLNFRSAVAPVVALCTAGVAYVHTLRISGFFAQALGVASPSELKPVVVAMLLGIVTDYVVFFCSALRHELAGGAPRHEAARTATVQFAPIIGVAGLAVAAGTGALVVAESAFFRALGPALVFTVLVGLLVAITLVPALMAVLGRAVFWPHPPATPAEAEARADAEPADTASPPASTASRLSPIPWIVNRRGAAAFTVAACTAGLVLAALPLQDLRLGVSFVGSLPPDTNVARAAAAAEAGFAPGILSPTVVLVEGGDVATQRPDLAEFGRRLQRIPGVAGVLGPGDLIRGLELDVLISRDLDAARYLVILEDPALGASAIATLQRIDAQLVGLLTASGLASATAGLAGDTATAAYIVEQTEQDILRIAVAALLANLLMLMLFLRALVAAVYLLLATLLSLAATLGLTTFVFGQVAPGAGLTFYVPFAAAVLLVAFGSDYNIFGVGHVWDEARRRPLREAVLVAMPRTTRAITAAGLALAASFGLLAVVPLQPFRQLAFAMFVGIVLDVVVVRTLLMPALVMLVGPASAWPSKRLYRSPSPTSRADLPAPA